MSSERECDEIGFDTCTVVDNVFRQCLFEEGLFICDCPSWFGYTGENCDKGSGQLTYFQTGLIFFLLVIIINFLIDSFMSYRLITFYLSSSEEMKTRVKSARIHILLFYGFCKHILFVTFIIINIIAGFEANRFELKKVDSLLGGNRRFERIYPINAALYVTTLYGSFTFLLFQTVEIASSWVSLIERLPSFMKNCRFERVCIFFKRIAPYFAIGFMLLWVILFSIGYFGDIAFIAVIFALTFLVLFILARHNFIRVIVSNESKLSDHLMNVVNLINRCALLIIIFWIIFWIAFGANIATADKYRTTIAGSFNLSQFFRDIALIAGFGLSFTATWYIAKLLNNFNIKFSVTPGRREEQSQTEPYTS